MVMFSFIILEGIINRFGLNASAAAGILDKIFLFATIPTNAFNASVSAMVAQNIGAGELERAFTHGIAFDASAILGFGDEANSDLFLFPAVGQGQDDQLHQLFLRQHFALLNLPPDPRFNGP